jgi:DNA anti-recombination protein RmuC
MIQNLSDQKAKLKENLNKEIDRYFEAFENSSNQQGFDINVIEKLMLENEKNLKTVMNEANSDLTSNTDAGVKKTAKNAEAP